MNARTEQEANDHLDLWVNTRPGMNWLLDRKFDAEMARIDHANDLKRLNACTGSCNQGRQCDCVPDYPTPYDVESERPVLTTFIAALVIVGTIVTCVLLASARLV